MRRFSQFMPTFARRPDPRGDAIRTAWLSFLVARQRGDAAAQRAAIERTVLARFGWSHDEPLRQRQLDGSWIVAPLGAILARLSPGDLVRCLKQPLCEATELILIGGAGHWPAVGVKMDADDPQPVVAVADAAPDYIQDIDLWLHEQTSPAANGPGPGNLPGAAAIRKEPGFEAFRDLIAAAEEAGWDQENPEVLTRARDAYAAISGDALSGLPPTRVFEIWQQFCRKSGEEAAVGVTGEGRQDCPVDQPLHLVDDAAGHGRVEPGHHQGDDGSEAVDQRVGIRITVCHGVTSVDIDLSKLPGIAAIRKTKG